MKRLINSKTDKERNNWNVSLIDLLAPSLSPQSKSINLPSKHLREIPKWFWRLKCFRLDCFLSINIITIDHLVVIISTISYLLAFLAKRFHLPEKINFSSSKRFAKAIVKQAGERESLHLPPFNWSDWVVKGLLFSFSHLSAEKERDLSSISLTCERRETFYDLKIVSVSLGKSEVIYCIRRMYSA